MMLPTALALLLAAPFGPLDAPVEHADPAANAQANVKLVIYDVADLLARPHIDFEGPKLGEQPHPAPRSRPAPATPPSNEPEPSDTSEPLTDGERATRNAKLLEGLVTKYITPRLEQPAETVAATHHGSLFANLRPEQHEWLQKFLDEQRRFDGLIEVEARAFRVQRGALQQLGVESSALLTNETERELFLNGVAKLRPAAEMITCPRLMMLANHRANIAVTTQVSYVKDYSVEVVEPGPKQIVVPQIGVIREGLMLDVRPTPMPGDVVALEFTCEAADVLRPIATSVVRLEADSGREVEIALPEVASAKLTSTVLIAAGASVVVSMPSRGSARDVVVLIRASRTKSAASSEGK